MKRKHKQKKIIILVSVFLIFLAALYYYRGNVVSYQVVKVVDGDTIDVFMEGRVRRVRLLGINTPETVDPRRPVECFGKEASQKTKALLENKRVLLSADPTQADVDKYGRLLRYVFLRDNTNVNKLLIEQGYAYEYTYQDPYLYQAEFKQAEKEARANKLGLWAPGVCGQ